MKAKITHTIIYHNKIKLIHLYLVNQLIQNSKALKILIFIHTKMRMYMIQECQMTDQIQKTYKIKQAKIQNSANNIFMI